MVSELLEPVISMCPHLKSMDFFGLFGSNAELSPQELQNILSGQFLEVKF